MRDMRVRGNRPDAPLPLGRRLYRLYAADGGFVAQGIGAKDRLPRGIHARAFEILRNSLAGSGSGPEVVITSSDRWGHTLRFTMAVTAPEVHHPRYI